jgi:hypothetical protein
VLLGRWPPLGHRRDGLRSDRLAGQIGVNPDQHIRQDARRLTELSTDSRHRPPVVFAPPCQFHRVLWMLSGNVVFQMTFTNVSSSC